MRAPIISPFLAVEWLTLVLGGLLLGLGAAIVATYLGPVYVLAVVCLAVGVVIVLNPRTILWYTLTMGILVTGVTQMYVPGSKYLKYVAPLMAIGLLLHVLVAWLSSSRRETPLTVPLFLLFLLVSLVSIAANWTSVGSAIVGFKNYFPMWAVFLGLTAMPWKPETINAIPKFFLWVALLQLPFVLHQYLYLVPLRMRIDGPGMVAADIVAGTFGGKVTGGGNNAVLSLFLISVAACIAGVWREGGIKAPTAVVTILALLAPIFVNSSKISVFYIPIAFLVVFGSDLRRRPIRLLLSLGGTAALVIGLVASYTALKPGDDSWETWFRSSIENQFASERERPTEYNGLTRWTSLTFWVQEHRNSNFGHVLIGHGPGSTRVQDTGLDLAQTLAEETYDGRELGYTALAALLWEVGVLGLAAVLALLLAGFYQAVLFRKRASGRDPTKAGIARGLAASMIIFIISLAHKDFLVYHIPFQTLISCVLGYLGAQLALSDSAPAEKSAA